MNFDDLIDTVKGKLYERLSNPILFSYTIFFISFNWRFFYKLFQGDSLASIDQYLSNNKFDLSNPFFYSIGYVIIAPILKLISEPYTEFVKAITLACRNYFRKNWQEQDMKTISEIEKKYIGTIESLRKQIESERHDYLNISESLKRMFRIENNISESLNFQLFYCSKELMAGDIALLDGSLALRGANDSEKTILGIVIGKAGSNYAYIANRGKIQPEFLDIREKHNISIPGKYILSWNNLSRLELIKDVKGNYRQIGILNDDGTFEINIKSYTN